MRAGRPWLAYNTTACDVLGWNIYLVGLHPLQSSFVSIKLDSKCLQTVTDANLWVMSYHQSLMPLFTLNTILPINQTRRSPESEWALFSAKTILSISKEGALFVTAPHQHGVPTQQEQKLATQPCESPFISPSHFEGQLVSLSVCLTAGFGHSSLTTIF